MIIKKKEKTKLRAMRLPLIATTLQTLKTIFLRCSVLSTVGTS